MLRVSAWVMASLYTTMAAVVLLGAGRAAGQGANGLVVLGAGAGLGLALTGAYTVALARSVVRVERLCEAMARRLETLPKGRG